MAEKSPIANPEEFKNLSEAWHSTRKAGLIFPIMPAFRVEIKTEIIFVKPKMLGKSPVYTHEPK